MGDEKVPKFCVPCITRLQEKCPHLTLASMGGFHFSGGEVWDDVIDYCADCGLGLLDLSSLEEDLEPTKYDLSD